MIKARLLLFAGLSQQTGTREAIVELEDGSSVDDAYQALCLIFPAITAYSTRLLFAINEEYVPASRILNDGDEVAVIPPVSGGQKWFSK